MKFKVTSEAQTRRQYTENATVAATAERAYNTNGSDPLSVTNGAAFAI